ncbi:MAG: hypothetical protein WCH78_11650 [Bacteroidota bacterium]
MLALRIFCLVTVTSIFQTNSAHAQVSQKDSSFLKSSINHALTFYDQNIGEQSGKYNGSQNIGYPQGVIDKNPYFISPNFTKGYIVYDQVLYDNVNLVFDESADLVVLQDSSHKIELITEKLEAFGIGDNHFRYLIKKDESTNDLLKTGYYQILVDNKISLFKKETKKISEKIVSNELSYTIGTSQYYYLKKEGRFYEIQNKKGFFHLLKDKEKELKKYIKTQHFNYRKDKNYTLSNAVEYYNLITK